MEQGYLGGSQRELPNSRDESVTDLWALDVGQERGREESRHDQKLQIPKGSQNQEDLRNGEHLGLLTDFYDLRYPQVDEQMEDLKLSNFDNYWPIRDMLKLHLKYKSERSRKKKVESKARRVEAAFESSSETDELESEDGV